MFRRLFIGLAALFVVLALNAVPAGAQQDPYAPTTVPPTTPVTVGGDRVERDPPTVPRRPLAFTGSDALPLARLGLVLLASGGVAVYAAKKRKDRQAAFEV